jgi:hypothetical protein
LACGAQQNDLSRQIVGQKNKKTDIAGGVLAAERTVTIWVVSSIPCGDEFLYERLNWHYGCTELNRFDLVKLHAKQ